MPILLVLSLDFLSYIFFLFPEQKESEHYLQVVFVPNNSSENILPAKHCKKVEMFQI